MERRAEASPRLAGVLAWVFLAAHVLAAALAASRWSATQDEPIHLAGGLAYWEHGDFRIHNENGNLPQRLAAFPLWLAGAELPEDDPVAWQRAASWQLGADFLFNFGRDGDAPMQLARRAAALWSVALGVVLLLAARTIAGPWAAACTLALYAAEPTLLAHGTLATSDVPATAAFLATLLAAWGFLWSPTPGRAAVLALACAVLALAKHSAVLVLPALAATAVGIGVVIGRRGGRAALGPWLRRVGWGAGAAGLCVWCAIWAAHGFRSEAAATDSPWGPRLDWERLGDGGIPVQTARLLADAGVLPQAYAYGFAYVVVHARQRAAFFAGEHRSDGWLGFFPTVALLKTPPLLLVAGAAGFAAAWASLRRRRWALDARRDAALPLLVFGLVYAAVSLTSNLNIGHRHLMPWYGIGVLCAGVWLAQLAARGRGWASAVAVLLAANAFEVHRHHPHHIAYFTPLVGGGQEGWRWLADSSLDWGQDLPALRTWQESGGARGEETYFAYFGPEHPSLRGVEATLLPQVGPLLLVRPRYTPGPGTYVLSATMLQEVYLPYRGGWDEIRERRYRDRLATVNATPPAERPATHMPFLLTLGTSLDGVTPQIAADDLEHLWLSRLCAYLRLRGGHEPVGYSLLAFRLDAEDVRLATEAPFDEMVAGALARRK